MPAPGPVVTTREAGSVDEIDAAFWPLLAMVELAALFVANRLALTETMGDTVVSTGRW